MRDYKRPPEPNSDPYQSQPLPLHKSVAVYYRQSSEGQVGNISTTLQTVDMVEHLVQLGWKPESILMIDMDAGISGSKAMLDRPGMSHVYEMIENQRVGLVASQDVDRFFRDVTMIQPNIFIDACKRNNVLVFVPPTLFDFNHPMQGRFHVQMFREQAQRAADYLEYHIRGRLLKSLNWRNERGMWAGRKIAPGFIVDKRKTLPDGSHNPNQWKYVIFEPYAEVVRGYFQLFQEMNGSQEHTWLHIQQFGPFFPEYTDELIPEGHHFREHLKWRSKITGKLCPSRTGLRFLLTNVVYLGHWVHKQAIVAWHNHEALIPIDQFMYAYNRIAPKDFFGDPNPNFQPYRPFTRYRKADRTVPPPTYDGLVFSDDFPELPHRRLAACWDEDKQRYHYILYKPQQRATGWSVVANLVDPMINQLLLERLKATTLDEMSWQQALEQENEGVHAQITRLEQDIRRLKQEQTNIINSLGKLTNDDMIARAQSHYEAATYQLEGLTSQLNELKSSHNKHKVFLHARPALEKITANWDRIPDQEKRNLFEAFARYIHVTRLSAACKQVTVHWRDGSTSANTVSRFSTGQYWDDFQLRELKALVESGVSQVEVLRAYPNYSWRRIMEKYAYHFGPNGKRYKGLFKGQVNYPNKTRWADTKEFLIEQMSQKGQTNPLGAESASRPPLHG